MLQGQQLLVEQLPQTQEFRRLAKVFRPHHFVEPSAEGLVIAINADASGIVRQVVGRFLRFAVRAEFIEVEVRVHVHRGGFALAFLVAERVLVQRHVFRCKLGVRFGAVLHRFRLVVVVLQFGQIVEFGSKTQIRQKRAAAAGELPLIVDALGQRFDVGAGALLHEIAPKPHHVLGGRGQVAAGEALADDEANGHAERRFGLRRHGVEGGLLAHGFQVGFQIAGDAFHPQRADGGHPGVLHPLEHLLRRAGAGGVAGMHGVVVVAHLQRELVANAPYGVQLLDAAADVRQWHMDVLPAQPRRALAESHIQFVVLGDGAQGRRGGPLVGFQRLASVRHRAYFNVTPRLASPKSSPMQRW